MRVVIQLDFAKRCSEWLKLNQRQVRAASHVPLHSRPAAALACNGGYLLGCSFSRASWISSFLHAQNKAPGVLHLKLLPGQGPPVKPGRAPHSALPEPLFLARHGISI